MHGEIVATWGEEEGRGRKEGGEEGRRGGRKERREEGGEESTFNSCAPETLQKV